MNKTNKQIADELSNGIINVSCNLTRFKNDPKVSMFERGEITKIELINILEETDEYGIIFLHGNEYRLQGKKDVMPLDYFVNPKNYEKIFSNYNIIKEVYPELSQHLNTKLTCESCNRNVHVKLTINGMIILGGIDRNLDRLKPYFDELFIEKLKPVQKHSVLTIDTLLKHSDSMQKTDSKISNIKMINKDNMLVGNCLSCVDEHISVAGIYLEQYHKDKEQYYTHVKRAVGHFSHAEIECFHIDLKFSKMIRSEKLKLKANYDYIPNIEKLLSYIKQ